LFKTTEGIQNKKKLNLGKFSFLCY